MPKSRYQPLPDFRSAYEGLNLELLSTDLTVVGYSERDPMAQNLFGSALFHCSLDVKSSMVQISSAESDGSCAPPELWRFLPRLGIIPNVQRPRPLFLFPASSSPWVSPAFSKTLLLLSLSFESSKGFCDFCLCRVFMHTKVLSLLSFSETQTLKELNPFSLSPSDGEIDALLAILHSSNLIVESAGCSTTLRRSFSGFFFKFTELKEFSSCACLHTDSMPSWQSYTELLRVLSSSNELTTEFFLCALLALAQCPLGRALQNSKRVFCLQLCLFYTALPSEVFNNLKGLPRVDDFSSCAHLACLCLNPQSSEVLLCTGIQNPQCSVTPSWHETTKNLSSLKIKQLLQMQTYSIHSQHK
jgi:hypothetical protein